MAVTHSIAHLACDPPEPATKLLAAVNKRLAEMYTNDTGNFVTAFYAIYDPADGTLDYANAGHPPPRIRRASGKIEAIEGAGSLPLGIIREEPYHPGTAKLYPGDTLVLYTDGITEARAPNGELFDDHRLDALLRTCEGGAQQVIAKTLWEVERFTNRAPATDDRTIVAAKVHAET
jgi:sigma-B regulation protein RsbU (phosphoserine phosphatase)